MGNAESAVQAEPARCKLRLLKAGHGDKVLAEWDPLVDTEVRAARAAWDEHVTPGRFVFDNLGEGRQRLLKEFDPTVRDIVVVPAIAGG